MFFKIMIVVATSFLAPAFLQAATRTHTLEEVNQAMGVDFLFVLPVYTPFPKEKREPIFTDEQFACIRQTAEAVKAAARNVFGSVAAFGQSLKEQRMVYRIQLSDMTTPETRKAYGEGKNYAHRYFDEDENPGSIFTRMSILESISMYVDPESGKIECAVSEAKWVEKFLRGDYQNLVNLRQRH